MLLTMLLFALGNIPLLAWIKARKSRASEDAIYSMHSSPRYGSFSHEAAGSYSDTSSHAPVTRDLNWFERIDASVLKQVFRR
jgi:hypothetical protein